MALAFRNEVRERPFLSGLALSLCLYKPTLVVLFVPMLLITRRFKTLVGFAAGAAGLVLLSTIIEGAAVWSGYTNLLISFGRASAQVHTHSFKELWKYVDLMSFSSLMPVRYTWLRFGVLFACAVSVSLALVRTWLLSASATKSTRTLAWAVTLTWTLIINVYVPIYDSILVVLSVVATAGVLKDILGRRTCRWFTLLWLLILVCSWITVDVAQSTGFQIITVLIAALGTVQIMVSRKASTTFASSQNCMAVQAQ